MNLSFTFFTSSLHGRKFTEETNEQMTPEETNDCMRKWYYKVMHVKHESKCY